MSFLDRAVSKTIRFVPKPIVGYFSRRYIAGARTEDAFAAVRRLLQEGAITTLDILGEGIQTREEAEENTRAYRNLVQRISEERLEDTNVSVKLSSLGLLLDESYCLENMRRVMEMVREMDTFTRIDMEDSSCTSATLRIYRTLCAEFPGRVGIVLQSRLRRTLHDVEELLAEPCNIRLCKGIYLEPRPIAYTDPELIRRNFVAILEKLIEAGAYAGIATHDEVLVYEGMRLVRKYGLTPDRYEFQMLLGVDEELRRIILAEGHRLRVYVPYGEQWYPYSVRRLRENPQLAGYAFRAIFRKA